MEKHNFDQNWRVKAECNSEDPEMFYPTGDIRADNRLSIFRAKAICDRCEVRSDCLQEALETREEWGIWGGLTESERGEVIQSRTMKLAKAGLSNV